MGSTDRSTFLASTRIELKSPGRIFYYFDFMVAYLEPCINGGDHDWVYHYAPSGLNYDDETDPSGYESTCRRCKRHIDEYGSLNPHHPRFRDAGVELRFLQLDTAGPGRIIHGQPTKAWAMGLFKYEERKGARKLFNLFGKPKLEAMCIIKPSRDGKSWRIMGPTVYEWTVRQGALWDVILEFLGKLSPGYESKWGYDYEHHYPDAEVAYAVATHQDSSLVGE